MIAVTEEHAALAASVRRWAEDHAGPATARAALDAEAPARPPFWDDLAAQGLLAIHVPEEHGGAGGGMVELAVVAEQLGRTVTPGPFVPTVAASAALLAGELDAAAKELLPRLADGSATGAVAPEATLRARRAGAGAIVSGTVRPVLGGASADVVLAGGMDGDREVWVALDADQLDGERLSGLDGTRSLAALHVDGVTVGPDRVLGGVTREVVHEALVTVFAAEAAGLAGWCLDTAAAYAKVREQFGRPIGQFQAVKHRCADMLVRAELARAAAYDAAVAFDDPEQRTIAVTVAAVIALDAAVDNANDCIQVLGGVGFTWEHDAHLFLKRAIALRQLVDGTGRFRQEAARLALAGRRRHLELDLEGGEADRRRAEVRAFVAEVDGLEGQELRDRLTDSGYAVPHWPAPWGRGAGPVEQLVIDEEFAAAGITKPNLVIGGWILPTIIEHGSAEQQERFIRPTVRGEIVWCQMFSEPGAGSDLAALQTRAERVEGGWELTGQKVWTSMAHRADWALCLARTSPDAPKHDGLTAFLVDVRNSDGLDVRPLREITGMELFNEVFLDRVFVPDELVVGEVDDGWRLARTTLSNERVAMSSGSSMGSSVETVLARVRSTGHTDDPVVLDRLGRLAAEGQTLSVLGLRATLRALSGTDPGAASSVRKLAGTENAMTCAELGLDLLGPEGATNEGAAQEATFTFLNSRCLSIAGGTTAVQKNVVAERILGLPRDDAD